MPTRIAIVGASVEELDISGDLRKTLVHKRLANFDFYEGELYGSLIVILITGWGKVRASHGVSVLNYNYSISRLYFIGACGAIGAWKQGDICIPEVFDYFDFNAYPIIAAHTYPQFENKLSVSNEKHRSIVDSLKAEFGERVHNGLALSGDSFVTDPDVIHRTEKMKGQEFGVIIDMESTAIAEVCVNLNMDFLIIRIVSDIINSESHTDFNLFLTETMPDVVNPILKIICNK